MQRAFSESHIYGSLILTTSRVNSTSIVPELFTDSSVGTIAIPSVWTSLEPGLGIVCGCLPTFPTLFRRWSELYSSKRRRSGSKLLSFTNDKFFRIRRTNKDSQQTDFSEDGTEYLRFDRDIEMEPETRAATISVGSEGSKNLSLP